MLGIAHVEEIRALLLELPAIADLQEQRSNAFPHRVMAWLSSLEDALAANRLYQTGQVAALRSELMSAEQRELPTGLAVEGRPTRSKVKMVAASQALQRGAELASVIMAENDQRFAEAERIAQQVVAASRSRGLMPEPDVDRSHRQYLSVVRDAFVASTDLENAFAHLEGLVGAQDALVLLDRALTSVAASEGEDAKWRT